MGKTLRCKESKSDCPDAKSKITNKSTDILTRAFLIDA